MQNLLDNDCFTSSSSKTGTLSLDNNEEINLPEIQQQLLEENIVLSEQLIQTEEDEEDEEGAINYYIRLAVSAILGIGTGFAMMPLFNKEVRELEFVDIDVHTNKYVFAFSTLNTLLVYSYLASKNTYFCLDKQFDKTALTNKQDNLLLLAKLGACLTPIFSISQLYDIEFHNQKVANSTGLDQFTMYAILTSIPLFAYYFIKSNYNFEKMILAPSQEIELSLKQKMLLYPLAASTLIGNGIIYVAESNKFTDHEILQMFCNVLCSLGAVAATSIEYQSLKKLFKENETDYSLSNIFKTGFSILESAWFSLPLVNVGLKVTESINNIIKGIIFSCVFVSHTVLNTFTFLSKR